MDLDIQRYREMAENSIKAGNTSTQVYARADEQERTGFTVSAPFTRLIASIMREMGH